LAGCSPAADRALAVLVFVAGDPLGVAVHRLDHLPGGLGEVGAVGEEVGVAEDVRHDELVLQDRVDVEQVGVARVGIDHQLVDLAQAIVVHRLHLLEGAPVRPVAEAARHAVGPELVHDRGRDDLEVGREGPQSLLLGHLPETLSRLGELVHVALIDHDNPQGNDE
jgi:hypothetical protein